MENWKSVIGNDWYEVSDLGRVRSIDRTYTRVDGITVTWKSKVLTGTPGPWGHLYVTLGRKSKHRMIHQLVLEAFVGPRPEGHFACHRNDVREDNRLENLYWGTPKENTADILRLGNNWNLNKTHCPKGHPLSGDNLLIRASNPKARRCMICTREYEQAYHQMKKELKS